MNSRNEAFAYALDFMLNDPKVVQVINDIVMRQYYHKSISLKSVWYLYNKEIQNLNLYDNIICEQMFCCAYNPESKIHNLIAGESTYSQICEAIKDYCTDNGLNNRQREKMLVQINLLWNVAVEKMHAATNPILDCHGEHVGTNKTQELRNAMVLGSHGSQSISQLIANIQDHNSDPSLVVGFWLMLDTAISSCPFPQMMMISSCSCLRSRIPPIRRGTTGSTAQAFSWMKPRRLLPICSTTSRT